MVTKSIVDQLIGRKYEKEELHNIMESTKAEFVGVYGRRRVGKTFLIRTFLNQKKYTFLSYQGQKGIDYKTQIDTFYDEVEKQFELEYQIKRSKNWQGAFKDLNDFMIKNISKKIVLFFDELPWFCAPKSGFLPALDYYWNQHWSKNKKIKLIVCGSSASWMIKNIVNAKGGLHNRLTRKMYVAPFQYNETKEYSIKHKLKLTDTQLLQLYMIFGGVPFYWSLLKKEAPISKQIDQLLFKNNSILKDELKNIFHSLFDNAELHLKIINKLAGVKTGIERNQLLKLTNIKTGGQAGQYLDNLKYSGFIEEFHFFGNIKKLAHYRLIDSFSYFASYWNKKSLGLVAFWENKLNTPKLNIWSGYAFENFCFNHIPQIIKALEITHQVEAIHSWRNIGDESEGVQIDLLIERSDNVVHIIEIKYSQHEFILKKEEAKKILARAEIFQEKTQYKGQIKIDLITPIGLKMGLWNDEVFNKVITLNDLSYPINKNS